MIWGYHYFWKHPHKHRVFMTLPKNPSSQGVVFAFFLDNYMCSYVFFSEKQTSNKLINKLIEAANSFVWKREVVFDIRWLHLLSTVWAAQISWTTLASGHPDSPWNNRKVGLLLAGGGPPKAKKESSKFVLLKLRPFFPVYRYIWPNVCMYII